MKLKGKINNRKLKKKESWKQKRTQEKLKTKENREK